MEAASPEEACRLRLVAGPRRQPSAIRLVRSRARGGGSGTALSGVAAAMVFNGSRRCGGGAVQRPC